MKALFDYLREREALKDGLSEVQAAHEYVLTMVQLEPSSVEWHQRLHASSGLIACHEQKLSSHKFSESSIPITNESTLTSVVRSP